MSTGRPPAPEVASMTTSVSLPLAPEGRAIWVMTPVEVSLWAQPTTSQPSATARMTGASPGSADARTGSSRNGAPSVTLANLEENSPKTPCWLRRRTRPQAPPDGADEVLDRLLAMGRAHDLRVVGQVGELLGADLRRSGAEAAVGGLELFRDGERGCARRHGTPRSRSG